MGTPADHLPKPVSEDAINTLLVAVGLPKANKIVSPKVTAQYHSIYMISLPPYDKSSVTELVLRVSGHHLPHIKTVNEVGVMSWVAKNTTIPIPAVVAYDSSAENAIAHEYTLLSRAEGTTLSDIYQTLSEDQTRLILDQVIDFLAQLHSHEWSAIGGLNLKDNGDVELGQVLDETFWQLPDIEKLWPEGETVASLNIGGPYSTYVEYISAQIRKYIQLIQIHEKLAFMREVIPRLEAFLTALPKHSDELNNVKLQLAHKDLHFANMLYDNTSNKITAVLDWEFSGVVPFTKWNPRRSFLWNGRDNEESANEKQRFLELFNQRCKDRGLDILEGAAYSSPLQESMQKVADFLRAIVEVAPRDQRKDLVPNWRATVLENIARFDS
ncbi:phosphotransferase enzyme family-domain-containing protein [Amylocarpus encephaloides]|uniref:Phosphotransferase enzyme family-domain-containing protein n=1 Tax=Amylocarpus encephaloides TaxID=45428 RepID=A0A9P7Y6I2_9HELO|nr:phosphotransferase enzyme family-domain-containing protein [Amylocarpus encephaloides]